LFIQGSPELQQVVCGADELPFRRTRRKSPPHEPVRALDDTVKDHFLQKLKKAGFRWLDLGIESGSKHVRDGVSKGRFGSEEIIKVVRDIQGAGINIIGNYIFCLPDDTPKNRD
jgi:radical SAM superfamily enzyme YgiQ (UPF0313 family)